MPAQQVLSPPSHLPISDIRSFESKVRLSTATHGAVMLWQQNYGKDQRCHGSNGRIIEELKLDNGEDSF